MADTLTQAPAAPPLALAVAFCGERARALLGGWVGEVSAQALADGVEGPDRLDALVVDAAPAGVGREEARRAIAAARERGVRVIGVAAEAEPEPVFAGSADIVFSERLREGALCAPAPLDPRVINPLGFSHSDVAGLALVAGEGVAAAPALAHFEAVRGAEPLVLLQAPGADEPPAGVLRQTPPATEAELLDALRERLGVLDHPSLHRDDAARARALVRLCAAGVPVVCAERSDELEALLGDELSQALAGVDWRALGDLDRREAVSVAQRRAALRRHSLDARWRALCEAAQIAVPERALVSVILSTRRQQWLSFGLAQVARQNYEPRELVVCLHGDDFSADVEERLRAEVSGPLEIVHVASEQTLGDALNAGVEVASGAYVTKMDDDDYYSVDHLADLVLALEYSGADLCGKAAEFVYLGEIDVTVRQLTRDVETRLAGGGMIFRRDVLRELGGWPSLSRAEDLAIVRRFEENGRRIHRTHPHGYILNRHGRDHTWRPYVDYFLFRSGRQWRGLRFDQTGIR